MRELENREIHGTPGENKESHENHENPLDNNKKKVTGAAQKIASIRLFAYSEIVKLYKTSYFEHTLLYSSPSQCSSKSVGIPSICVLHCIRYLCGIRHPVHVQWLVRIACDDLWLLPLREAVSQRKSGSCCHSYYNC